VPTASTGGIIAAPSLHTASFGYTVYTNGGEYNG
jgi:hypothetical protein